MAAITQVVDDTASRILKLATIIRTKSRSITDTDGKTPLLNKTAIDNIEKAYSQVVLACQQCPVVVLGIVGPLIGEYADDLMADDAIARFDAHRFDDKVGSIENKEYRELALAVTSPIDVIWKHCSVTEKTAILNIESAILCNYLEYIKLRGPDAM